MITTTQELSAWFEQRAGETVTVEKREGQDRDRVRLKLERAELNKREETIDAYIPNKTLYLYGDGTIHNPGEEPVPLPESRYEIALDGLISHTESAGALTIKTTRAEYRIEG